ncbi:MAG: hypothetical protein AUJ47_10915 [Candidatus Marinimicrobia bacterium CG1_02_48_14]|nr:MAG: hypothetical protein AUJ47_10915 [Candidatus Marinimicrobia bacterium CG1_02_48_14]
MQLGNSPNTSRILFIATLLLILTTRLPFLSIDLGLDTDAYGVVIVSDLIRTTGVYMASRIPGFPLTEYLYSLVTLSKNPFLYNFLTALISLIGIATYGLIVKHLIGRDVLVSMLAFALIPAIFINSTNAMDYLWGLTFILIAFYLVLIGVPIWGGISLGLAIGARITSGAMLIPFIGYLWLSKGRGSQNHKKSIVKLSFFTLITGLICFLPVINRYGPAFFNYYHQEYPSPYIMIYHIYKLFGVLGSVAIALGIFFIYRDRNLKISSPGNENQNNLKALSITCVAAIFIYLLAYLYFPDQAGYLIPIIPFLLLLLQMKITVRHYRILLMLFLLSPFLVGIQKGSGIKLGPYESHFTLKGPTLINRELRLDRKKKLTEIIVSAQNLNDATKIVTASYYPLFQYATRLNPKLEGKFVGFMSRSDYNRDSLFTIYYLIDDVAEYNKTVTGFSLKNQGVKKFCEYKTL